jgi:hypothetical protein
MRVRRTPFRLLIAATATLATTAVLVAAPPFGPASRAGDAASAASATGHGGGQKAVLKRYLQDTWKSFEAMAVPATGLPSDNIGGDLEADTRSGFTSPTNMGAYLWSTVAARDAGVIGKREAHARMAQTIDSIGKLEKHQPSGMFYNWYDPATLEKLTTFPDSGDPIEPFLSSVDNGWLATGLLLAGRAEPKLAKKADAIRNDMNFGCYYNEAEGEGGQIRGGFWDEPTTNDAAVLGDYCGMGQDVWYTGHHYGTFNTEPRIASYLGIASGQIPAKHYYGTFRTFPGDNCDFSWSETKPVGEWKTYDGIRVFEGALPYRGMNIVPTWGGSMFEALMVPLFVPEEKWGPRSWGRNHPLYVRGQIEHGMDEADYGYWGFSPSNNPEGGYREYGVDMLGMDGPGYTSDTERTAWEQPYGDCRAGTAAPTEYGDGVVTPHASFLALRYAPKAALENLSNIKRDFDAYGKGGFYDAIATRSGTVSQRYLALDQGMIMAALGNALAGDDMRRYVSRGAVEQKLRPLMEQEVFASSPY